MVLSSLQNAKFKKRPMIAPGVSCDFELMLLNSTSRSSYLSSIHQIYDWTLPRLRARPCAICLVDECQFWTLICKNLLAIYKGAQFWPIKFLVLFRFWLCQACFNRIKLWFYPEVVKPPSSFRTWRKENLCIIKKSIFKENEEIELLEII